MKTKTFIFSVTQTDVYNTTVKIEAKNEQEARKLLAEDLEECPINTRSNTSASSNVEYILTQ